MKKLLAVILVAARLAVSFGAVKRKKRSRSCRQDIRAWKVACRQQAMPNVPKVDRKVVVSKEVTAKWKAVKLAIENKTAKTTKEYTVTVGSELAVPNTKMKVKVLAFLPDFKMGDKEITSASDKPNNPAAQVVVTEHGKEEWKGWLYSLHPGIHPFPA